MLILTMSRWQPHRFLAQEEHQFRQAEQVWAACSTCPGCARTPSPKNNGKGQVTMAGLELRSQLAPSLTRSVSVASCTLCRNARKATRQQNILYDWRKLSAEALSPLFFPNPTMTFQRTC